jgi:hypothetical protein
MAAANNNAERKARLQVYIEKMKNNLNSPPAKHLVSEAKKEVYLAWVRTEIRKTEATIAGLA